MSFADIESKASKEEGKKNKKAEPAPRALGSPRRINSPRQRKSLAKAKWKKRRVQASGLPRRSKTLVEAKEESHASKALGSPRRRKTTLILDTCLRQGEGHFAKVKNVEIETKMPSFSTPFLVIFHVI